MMDNHLPVHRSSTSIHIIEVETSIHISGTYKSSTSIHIVEVETSIHISGTYKSSTSIHIIYLYTYITDLHTATVATLSRSLSQVTLLVTLLRGLLCYCTVIYYTGDYKAPVFEAYFTIVL